MATKLVSLKGSKRETVSAAPMMSDAPDYPYGLTLTLEEETIQKLGLEDDDLEVGYEMLLVAKVRVTSSSSHDSEENGVRRCVCLQLTDACVEDADDAAGTLYGKKK